MHMLQWGARSAEPHRRWRRGDLLTVSLSISV